MAPGEMGMGTILSAVKTGYAIIDENKRRTIIKRLKLLVRTNRKIVIFGLSGVGKTQFIRSLMKSLEIPLRTDVTEKTRHNLDDFPIQFIDTPGHSERQTARRTEIDNIIKLGVEGINNNVWKIRRYSKRTIAKKVATRIIEFT